MEDISAKRKKEIVGRGGVFFSSFPFPQLAVRIPERTAKLGRVFLVNTLVGSFQRLKCLFFQALRKQA
jgi:hypothetical protein